MKVLVCGGRDYDRVEWLFSVLDQLHEARPITEIIHGGARGADTLAGCWASANDISTTVFKANWNEYGRSAGGIRNKQMLEEGEPDLIVAFPGGPGTRDMVLRSKRAGKRLVVMKE